MKLILIHLTVNNVRISRMKNDEMTYCETHKTMNTRNIYGMLLCCKEKKPIRHEKTKLQTAMVISLWFCGLLVCPEYYCDWSLHNKCS